MKHVSHPMPYSLILFDMDGTVRQCKEHKGPCHNKEGQWEIVPGTKEILLQYNWSEIGIGFVTNQAAIAYSYTTKREVEREIELTIRALFPDFPDYIVVGNYIPSAEAFTMHHLPMRVPEYGVCYRYSPFSSEASSYARKPSPWMILDLIREYGERLDKTLYVGDSPEDQEAAIRAGVSFVWAWQFFGRPKQEPNITKSHLVTMQDWERVAK